MKYSFFIILLMILALNSFAQVQQEWVARYNGPGNYFDEARAIVIDKYNNVYVTGYCTGSGKDFCTIKYNANGVQLWVRYYNGPSQYTSIDIATCIAIDSSGNIYVTGYSESNNNNHKLDYATIKYDSMGSQKWVQRYDGPASSDDNATGILVDINGNLIVTGSSIGNETREDYCTIKYNTNGQVIWINRYNGPANFWDDANAVNTDLSGNIYVTGGSFETNTSWYDFLTIKYDSSGNQIWINRYNGPQNFYDMAKNVVIDMRKNVYVSGTSEGGRFDYCLIKYDSSGALIWIKRYDYQGYDDILTKSVLDNSGNIILTGYSNEVTNSYSFCTVKIDSSGNQVWAQRFRQGGYRDFKAWDIKTDVSDNVYVVGEGGEEISGYYDYCTLKYNAIGNLIWKKYYNGTANDEDRAYGIVIDNNQNIYVTGMSRGNGQYSNPDYVTVKYSQPIGIQPISSEIPQHFSLHQNYPNPFNPTTKIKFEIPQNIETTRWVVSLRIFDILGREVSPFMNENLKPGVYEVEFNATDLPSGVYFYKLSSGQFVDTKKMILVK